MSIRLEPAEYSRVCDRIIRTCTPVDFHHQQAWMNDWKVAADRMHYLTINHLGASDSLRTLIRVRASLKKPNLNLELIKPDVENLWNEIAAKADEAAHAYYANDNGFECCFIAVTENTYISGSVVVNRFTPSSRRT